MTEQRNGHDRTSPQGRKALVGAIFGLSVDYYDLFLPTVALTPAIRYFQPAGLAPTTIATIGFAILAATFLGRPIGAFLFGHLGDTFGRKPATMVAIGGAAVVTFLIGVLPGYQVWGSLSLVLLLAARLVGGIFLGGEYSSANPLAIEATPKHRRGLVGGLIMCSYSIGYVAISVVTFLLLALLPADDLYSPYVQWGWRIPFLVGTVVSIAFLFYYRKVEESEIWRKAKTATSAAAPLRQLFRGGNARILEQVFILQTGMWLAVQAVVGSLPGLLQNYFRLPARTVTTTLLIGTVMLAAAYLTWALLGQRYGRRRMLIVAGATLSLPGTGTLFLMSHSALTGQPVITTMLWCVVTLLIAGSPFAISMIYLAERFPAEIRASGYGIGYSLAIVIPSFSGFYMLGLSAIMPYGYTPIVFMVLSGAFVIVGALMGPETRDVDLTADAAKQRSGPLTEDTRPR
ncbi:MFS transporter [Amycolatopsis jiangsuensis]